MSRLIVLSLMVGLSISCFTPTADADDILFRDIIYSANGDATLSLIGTPESGSLLVSNIGSSGMDGVSAQLPENCCLHAAYWDPLSVPDDGDLLRFRVIGTLDETPEQLLGILCFEDTGPEITLSVELRPGTALLNQMQVFDGFTVVYNGVIDDVGVAATVSSWPDGVYVESICSDALRTSITYHWNTSTTVSVPGGPTVSAQAIEVISMAFSSTLSLLTIEAAGIPSILILDADYALQGSAVDDGIPSRTTLGVAAPNPFNPQTTIAFDLPSGMAVSLRVYDVSGRLVDVLVDGEIAQPGRNEVVWRGRDELGRQLPSGTYFYRLEAGGYVETKMMTLLK